MAVSKRKKKVRKGKGRVKAAQGGKPRRVPTSGKPSRSIIDKVLIPSLGASFEDLIQEGAENFPNIPEGSRHHAAAAKRASERFGFVPSQILGAGVEILEGLTPAKFFKQDTLDDFKANAVGGFQGSIPGRLIEAFKNRKGDKGPSPSSTPRGKHGGRMTAEAAASGRGVA
ncbi:hypothetical protein LCGC14_2549260, partial [marine sediment metagenome]